MKKEKDMNENMAMNEGVQMMHREMTALQGEAPHGVGGLRVRQVSLESLSVLQMVGSPLAPVLNAALSGTPLGDAAPAVTAVDISVICWAHVEDADEVLRVALQCAPGFDEPARAAALPFVRAWSMELVGEVMQRILGDANRVAAAAFEARAPEYGDSKKNS